MVNMRGIVTFQKFALLIVTSQFKKVNGQISSYHFPSHQVNYARFSCFSHKFIYFPKSMHAKISIDGKINKIEPFNNFFFCVLLHVITLPEMYD